jgi:hypothetical protein
MTKQTTRSVEETVREPGFGMFTRYANVEEIVAAQCARAKNRE